MKCSLSTSDENPRLKLLLIGLDNAGKTSTVMHLLGRPISEVVPTLGFTTIEMKEINKFKVEIYDLGGGAKIRNIWKNYFALVHGVIFVVDSSDQKRVSEVRQVLEQVIQHDQISMKPILVLINKQDVEGALDEIDISKEVNLETLINKYKCPTRIESSSAIACCGKNGKPSFDSGIEKGYLWIVSYIIKNWKELNERVCFEEAQQVQIEKQVMAERYKRYRDKNEEESKVTSNGQLKQDDGDKKQDDGDKQQDDGDKRKNDGDKKQSDAHRDEITEEEIREENVIPMNGEPVIIPEEKEKEEKNEKEKEEKKKEKKKMSLFKSNKITPLAQAADSNT